MSACVTVLPGRTPSCEEAEGLGEGVAGARYSDRGALAGVLLNMSLHTVAPAHQPHSAAVSGALWQAEDARVTLRLFKLLRVQWEQYLRNPKKLRAKVMQLRPHRALMAPAARPVNGAPSDATGSGGGVPSSAVAGAVGSDRGGPISGAVPCVLALLRRHPRFCGEVGATAAAAAAAAATSGGATADHALTPAQRRRLRTVGTLANSGSGSGSGGQPAGDVGALPWKVLARAETAMEFMSSDTDSDEGDARGDGHSRGNSSGDSDASGDYDSDADWGL